MTNRVLLIVEDRELMQALEQTLLGEGIEVEVLPEGGDLGARLKDHEHLVVILDADMRSLPGAEYLARIRAAAAEVPCVVLTGVSSGIRDRLMAGGATDYVDKPLDRVRLKTAVKHAIDCNALRARVNNLQTALGVGGEHDPDTIVPMEKEERRILSRALRITGWNVKETARKLGIGRATVYRKIDRYHLRDAEQKPSSVVD